MKKLVVWTKGIQRSLVLITIFLGALAISSPLLSPGGVGLYSGSSVVKKTVTQLSKNKTEETTITEGSGKTVWDWLVLLGVPLSLALLGAWFQFSQQKQATATAKEHKEQAESNLMEEVLQRYFDRVSTLIIDKNLMAIFAKGDNASAEEKELLEVSIDVMKARTLSILRRFGNDSVLRNSAVRFLAETDVISRLQINLLGTNLSKIDLSGTDLSGTDLRGADLSSTNLHIADLSNTNLREANLYHANLSSADLSIADLSHADLSVANLNHANLSSATLRGANMIGANLSSATICRANLSLATLIGANLSDTDLSQAIGLIAIQLETALLCRTQLPEDLDLDSNRDCEDLGIRPTKLDKLA